MDRETRNLMHSKAPRIKEVAISPGKRDGENGEMRIYQGDLYIRTQGDWLKLMSGDKLITQVITKNINEIISQGVLTHGALSDVSSDQHHNKQHSLTSAADHTGTLSIAMGGTNAGNSNTWLNSRITTSADGSLNYDATGATAVNHDSLTGFASNEHYTQASIVATGTIVSGTWQATDVGIAYGGTGQSTAATAADALLNVSQGGALSIGDGSDTITIPGNLTVSGTTTTIDTTLTISDAMVINNGGTDVGLKINSTSSGHMLQVQDNGIDILVVKDGGNVGIGTASPGAALHIEDNSANQVLLMKSTGAYHQTLKGDANRSGATQNLISIYGTWNGTDVGYIRVQTGTDTSNKDDGRIQFATAAAGTPTVAMTIASDQNVGIGTTSPDAKLHIVNASTIGGSGGTYTNAALIIGDDGATDGFFIDENEIHQVGDNFNMYCTTAGKDFKFWLQGSEKVTFEAGGNVGIGTTDPYYSLHIDFTNTTIALEGGSDGNWGGNGLRIENNSSTVNTMAIAHFRTNSSDWHIGSRYIAADSSDFFFKHENVERLTILGSGNVGIGTSTPGFPLDVFKGSDGVVSAFTGASENGVGIKIFADDGSQDCAVYGYDDDANAYIKTYFGRSDGSSGLVVDTNGNVGIGTSSPDRKLHIMQSDSSLSPQNNHSSVIIEENASTYLEFLTPSANTSGIMMSNGTGGTGRGYCTYQHSNDRLQFGASGATKMVIKGDTGNVGIGTTSPATNLHIAGTTTGAGSMESNCILIENTDGSTGAEVGIKYSNYATASNFWYEGLNQENDMAFAYGTSFSAANTILTIKAEGNVGIGTTSPATLLELEAATPVLTLDATTDNATLRLDAYNTSHNSVIDFHQGGVAQASINFAHHGTPAQEEMRFIMGGPSNRVMTILGSGKVGIGESAPDTTLEVLSGTTNQLKLSFADGTDTTFGTDTDGYLTITPSGNNILLADSVTNLRNTGYTSGLFTGDGWGIYKSGSDYNLEVDNLWVRGSMFVWELVINQIRATNGSLVVTSAAKVSAVANSSGSTWELTFETGTVGAIDYHPFANRDLIMSHEFTLGSAGSPAVITESQFQVSDISYGAANQLQAIKESTTDDPTVGMTFVRVGNTIDEARQGGVLLTSDDSQSPFIDIWNGVTDFANGETAVSGDWEHGDKVKMRLGKLDGQTGGTNEYGMWAGKTSTNYIKASTSGVFIKASEDTYLKVDASSLEFYDINGSGGSARKMDITGGSIKMYADNGSTVMTEWDNTALTLGGATGDTSYTTVIAPASVILYGSSSDNGVFITSDGVEIKQATNDSLAFTAGSIIMKKNNVAQFAVSDHGMNIGPIAVAPASGGAPAAVIGNVSVHSGGVNIYGGTVNDHVAITSTGMTVTSNSVIRLKVLDAGVTCYGDNNTTFSTMTSSGFKVFDNDANNPRTVIAANSIILGKDGEARTVISDTAIDMYDGASTPVVRVNLDSSGNLTLGKSGEARTIITDTAISMYDGASTPVVRVNLDNSGNLTLGKSGEARTVITDTAINLYDGASTPVVRVNLDNSGNLTLGKAGEARTVITDTTMSMYDGASTPVKIIDIGSGSINLGPSANAGAAVIGNISLSGSGATIYGGTNVNNNVEISATGMTVDVGGAEKASFGANTIITGGSITLRGNTGSVGDDQLVIGSASIALYTGGSDAGDKKVDINDSGINIGPGAVAGTAVIGNVRLGAGGAFIYGAATNDYVNVKADGVDVVAAGVTQAAFGATTTIGKSGDAQAILNNTSLVLKDDAGTTLTELKAGVFTLGGADGAVAGVLKADANSVTIYADDANTKTVLSSAGLKIFNNGTEADDGTGVSHFGTTMRIGAVADDTSRLEIDTSGNLTIKNRQSTTDTTLISLTSAGAAYVTGSVTMSEASFTGGNITMGLSGAWGSEWTGDSNISIGGFNGGGTGDKNIRIGAGTGRYYGNVSNTIVIGEDALQPGIVIPDDDDNQIRIGNEDHTDTWIKGDLHVTIADDADFESEDFVGTDGYVKIGKFIMQWGKVTSSATSVTVTFPTVFTNACLNVTCTDYTSGDNGGFGSTTGIKTLPTTTTVVFSNYAATTAFFWTAIGY